MPRFIRQCAFAPYGRDVTLSIRSFTTFFLLMLVPVFSLLFSKVATNSMSPEEFSQYGYYIAISSILVVLPLSAVEQFFFQKTVSGRANDYIMVPIASYLIFFSVLALFVYYINLESIPLLYVLFFICFSLKSLFSGLSAVVIGPVFSASIKMADPVMRSLYVIFIFPMGFGIELINIGVLLIIPLVIVGFRNNGVKYNFGFGVDYLKKFKECFVFSFPVVAWGIPTTLMSFSPVIFLEKFGNAQDAGIYSLFLSLAMLGPNLLVAFCDTYYRPVYNKNIVGMRRILLVYLSFCLLGWSVAYMLSEELIWFASNEYYAQWHYLLPVLLLGCIANGVGTLINYYFFKVEDTVSALLINSSPSGLFFIFALVTIFVTDNELIVVFSFCYLAANLCYSFFSIVKYRSHRLKFSADL